MLTTNQLKNQHLMWRAGFGPQSADITTLNQSSPKDIYHSIRKNATAPPATLNITREPIDYMVMGMNGLEDQKKVQKLTIEQRRALRKQSVLDIRNMNIAWLDLMTNGEAGLREKMSLFWHGHFACRVVNYTYQQQLLQVIRENALGSFADLLRAVSKSPAMLSFLNNQQNRKQHPNENFAREVMELFTMGRGNYTEKDVKEGARAFTGWGFNAAGDFVDRPYLHDAAEKTFLGTKGTLDGDDVIDIILEQKATAQFITRKIYRYFVNDQVDEKRVTQLAEGFRNSKYSILHLMDSIFQSDWFYDTKNMGVRIKSPVELIVGIRRMIPMTLEKPDNQVFFERVLGQVLFYPPNVAGWPGGQNWIDSSSLLFRMKLPQILTDEQSFLIKPKDDDDQMMGLEGADKIPKARQVNAKIDWVALTDVFKTTSKEMLFTSITSLVLQTGKSIDKTILNKYVNDSSRESYIKSTMIALMSTPEYQLC